MIDWSKAPEGATHYREKGGMFYGGFYKQDLGDWWFFADDGWESIPPPEHSDLNPLIPRPTKPEWVDGLPPVGEECEAQFCAFSSNRLSWAKVKVVGYDNLMVVCRHNASSYFAIEPDKLRPIRTPEEKQREELAELVAGAARIDEVKEVHRTVASAILSKYNLTEK